MSKTKRILVAEDNVVLGDVLQFNLQRSGYLVTLVRDGDNALRTLMDQRFDVLVADYEMPGLNGEELCDQARNHLKLNSLKIIMCSARGMELDRESLKKRHRIENIFFKPFSIRELTNLIDGLFVVAADSAPELVSS